MLQMGARRDFRNNAPERLVVAGLAEDKIGQNAAIRADQRDGGFVTGCFDAQNDHGGGHL